MGIQIAIYSSKEDESMPQILLIFVFWAKNCLLLCLCHNFIDLFGKIKGETKIN